MNEGVKILLERIKTNPEEFEFNGRDNKWESLVYRYSDWLDEEDKTAFKDAMKQMRQEKFTQEIMKELLAPEEDDDMGKWFTKRGNATVSAGVTPVVPSISLSHNEHLRAHLNALKREVEVVRKPTTKKPHETLYGKLKNYLHSDT